MATVKAFRGMRYQNQQQLDKLVTPPYDIISPKQQEQLYNKHENNIIRLEYGKEFPEDQEKDNKYTRAGAYLHKWLEEGVLQIEDKPCFYVYEEEFGLPDGSRKKIRGLVCRVKLQEFSENVVLPHEETLSKAKTDRLCLMEATQSNFSQIYSLYVDKERRIPQLIDQALGEKTVSFVDEDGITQSLWIIRDDDTIAEIEKAFENKQLFIADGHHRYETALNYKKAHPDNPEAGYVMMFLIDLDNDGLVVFPTHRMVQNVEEFDGEQLAQSLKDCFDVEAVERPDAALIENSPMPAFLFYAGKNFCWKLTLRDWSGMEKAFPGHSKAYQQLDVNVLHTLVLERLGIDAKNMAMQKNLVYTRSLEEAVEKVDDGQFQCSFLLNATRVDQIKDVSLAGEKMPQKSTYFYPKLKTGLVMNHF